MLFVGLFRNQGNGRSRHVAQEVQDIAVGRRRVFQRQGIQAFPRELADAETDGPIRQQAAFGQGNEGSGSGHGVSNVRGYSRGKGVVGLMSGFVAAWAQTTILSTSFPSRGDFAPKASVNRDCTGLMARLKPHPQGAGCHVGTLLHGLPRERIQQLVDPNKPGAAIANHVRNQMPAQGQPTCPNQLSGTNRPLNR